MKKFQLIIGLFFLLLILGSCSTDNSTDLAQSNENAVTGQSEESVENCNHVFTDTIIQPSCTKNGYTLHTCEICGYSYSDSIVKKNEHKYGDWEIISEATLTVNGKRRASCLYCNASKQESYQHEWNANATIDVLKFIDDGFECTVRLKDTAYSGEIRVPAISPKGTVVSIIDNSGFYASCASSIQLPETIIKIGNDAFANCKNLTSITIPTGVKQLGNSILKNSPYVKTVYFNATNCNGMQYAPWGDSSQVETLIVGDNVNYIPGGLFQKYSALKNVTLGKNVTTIYSYAFEGTTSLKTIQFPEGLQVIKEYAFFNSGLTSIVLPSTLKRIENDAFANIHLNCDQLVIPKNLQYIGSNIFSNSNAGTVKELVYNAKEATSYASMMVQAPFLYLNVEKITISKDVVSLGDYLFAGIDGVTTITIDIHDNTLPKGLFSNATTLEKVVLGSNIRKLEPYVFENCGNLEEIQGIERITHLGEGSFAYCTKVTSFDFTNILEWDKYVFNESGLSTVILPDDMTVLPAGAFSGCRYLKTLALPSKLVTISADAFYSSGIETLTIPNTVTSIGMYAFRYCKNLYEIELSDALKTIGYSCFEQCTSLKKLELPNGFTTLGEHALFGCSGLEYFIMPQSMTTIPSNCFSGCSSLREVVLMNQLTDLPYGLFSYCAKLESVTLPQTLKTIGDLAFFNCMSLKSIVIPDSCMSIGRDAFYGCTQLETVTFGANITKIGGSAFSHCSSLKEVRLPDTVTELGSWAFSDCTALEKLYIGTAITNIGSEAFKNCIALKSVFLPNSLLAFSPSNSDQPVFYGCNNLVIYTEVETIPVIWSIHFGTYILKDYTYDEYLSITTNTEKSN